LEILFDEIDFNHGQDIELDVLNFSQNKR